jgi:hypothetical protein
MVVVQASDPPTFVLTSRQRLPGLRGVVQASDPTTFVLSASGQAPSLTHSTPDPLMSHLPIPLLSYPHAVYTRSTGVIKGLYAISLQLSPHELTKTPLAADQAWVRAHQL